LCNRLPVSPYNERGNPSIVLQRRFPTPQVINGVTRETYNVLVDCGKTFCRTGLKYLRPNNVTAIDAVLLTHFHSDAVGGLDDLREVQAKGTVLPIYANAETCDVVRQSFPYMFPDTEQIRQQTSNLFVAACELRVVEEFSPLHFLDLTVLPLSLNHGNVVSLGFLVRAPGVPRQFAYFSDFRVVPSLSRERPDGSGVEFVVTPEDIRTFSLFTDPTRALAALREHPVGVMILDALHTERRYFSHSNVPETVELHAALCEAGISPTQVLLTGMSCSVNFHDITEVLLKKHPAGTVLPAYDGLSFELSNEEPLPPVLSPRSQKL